MHIKVARAAIAEALNNAQAAVTAKTTLVVLQNVKIDAENGKAVFTCSDLDMTLISSIECEVIEEGSTTLPVKLLATAIGKVVDGIVEIDVGKDDKARIKAGTSVFRLNGIPAKEFPTLPAVNGSSATIPANVLREMFRKVSFAMSQDETRRSLNGVNLSFKENGKVVSVATDGRRLAMLECEAEFPKEFVNSVIIPKKTVDVLLKRLPKDGDVVVTLAGAQLRVECPSLVIMTKLIDEQYPNVAAVIPTANDKKVVLERVEFLGAIDRVSIFSAESDSFSMNFKFENNTVVLSSKETEIGDGRDEMPVVYNGEAIEAVYNPQYVRDALNVIDEDDIEFNFSNAHAPVVIRNSNGTNYTYVLMPLRVK